MSKTTKKQPYRNALLKIKKERFSLDSLYKENQRLNADALYKQKEAQVLLNNSAKNKEKAKMLFDEAVKELHNSNAYHPALFNSSAPISVSCQDALLYRIVIPNMDWDDSTDKGMVRMVFSAHGGIPQTVAYAFSGGALKHSKSHICKNLIDDLSKKIATQLTTLVIKKMKEQ